MENNRNQSYQQDWNDTDQGYDRYREQNRNQVYGNYRRNENQRNTDWQNSGDWRGNDQPMNRNYENRGSYDRNRNDYNTGYQNRPDDYRSNNWNQGNENRNYNRNYDYENDRNRNQNTGERNWWDRTSDEVASWFGDDDAERRRRMDKLNGPHRGKGPKGYRRSDERIKEDINEKLYHDSFVDASDIEVSVIDCEVTLTGTVDSREAKRRAEDLAEEVSGVKDVTNQLKVSSTSQPDNSNQYNPHASDQYNGRKKSSWLS
jgi:osmotically-inducible protein OsmY